MGFFSFIFILQFVGHFRFRLRWMLQSLDVGLAFASGSIVKYGAQSLRTALHPVNRQPD